MPAADRAQGDEDPGEDAGGDRPEEQEETVMPPGVLLPGDIDHGDDKDDDVYYPGSQAEMDDMPIYLYPRLGGIADHCGGLSPPLRPRKVRMMLPRATAMTTMYAQVLLAVGRLVTECS